MGLVFPRSHLGSPTLGTLHDNSESGIGASAASIPVTMSAPRRGVDHQQQRQPALAGDDLVAGESDRVSTKPIGVVASTRRDCRSFPARASCRPGYVLLHRALEA